jgi:hypothetical protein
MKEGTCVKAETAGGWEAGDAGRRAAAEAGGMRESGHRGGKRLGSRGMCKWARAFAAAESALGLAYLPDRSPLA